MKQIQVQAVPGDMTQLCIEDLDDGHVEQVSLDDEDIDMLISLLERAKEGKFEVMFFPSTET